MPEALRSIAYNHANDPSRKHDLKIVVFAAGIWYRGHCKRQHQSNSQAKKYSQRQLVYLFCKIPDQNTRDQALYR